ncbi:MAG TPA: hypothetical protein VMF13_10765, partial [Luteitalea sp.]|nr:hypothetical protein [Luteitalea sp.]
AANSVDIIATGPNLTGPHLVAPVMSANGRYVAWVEFVGLRVFDRSTRTLQTHAVGDVVGPEPTRGWISEIGGISEDGRYVVLKVPWSSTYLSGYALVRFDRQTGTRLMLARSTPENPSPDVQGAAMSRDGQTLAWLETPYGGQPRVMAWLPGLSAATEVGRTCSFSHTYSESPCINGPAVTGDGRFILYTAGGLNSVEALAYYDTATGARDYYPEAPGIAGPWHRGPYTGGLNGRFVGVRSGGTSARPHGLFGRATHVLDRLTEAPGRDPVALSDDGQIVLMDGFPASIVDRRSGLLLALPLTLGHALTGDGRYVLGSVNDAETGATELRVIDLDGDNDGMLDGWERQFGLNPADPADATADPDGDGQTNAAEFAARSHPTAQASATRLFAEGAGGSFFDTTISLFNPGTVDNDIVVRFLPTTGSPTNRALRLAPKGRIDLSSCCLPTLTATEFAVVVEATSPVVADRRMTWDLVTGYGSHASTGVAAPATTWYFAEGATVGGLQTFLLLQNPGTVDGVADIEYLLANGTQVTRSHAVPAGSRVTVWVNQEGAPLGSNEFATVVRSTVPMVAERALYRDAGGQVFAAGTNAIGVTAPADRWFFAEGTTRGGFDTFVLAANPSDAPVTVDATFSGTTGPGAPVSVSRSYVVAPRSRLTIWVNQEDALLADADISTTLQASGPIVAERAMWWRNGGPEWIEGHVEFGATETGTSFAIADAATLPLYPLPSQEVTETYVLVGTQSTTPGRLRLTAYPSSVSPWIPPDQLVRETPTTGQRTTLLMSQVFPFIKGSFSVVVESLPVEGTPVPIVVERAIYSGGLAAGAAAKATKLQ